jgi:hypothetical protein
MIDDNASAESPFKVTDLVWSGVSQTFRNSIDAGHINDIWQFNTKFAMWPPGDRHYEGYATYMGHDGPCLDWYARACELYLERLRSCDDHGVISSANAEPDWDELLSLEAAISLINEDPTLLTEPHTIVDLGAGWGRFGYVMLRANPKLTYVACDIPESLSDAQAHLPSRLPNANRRDYMQNRTIPLFTRGLLQSSPGIWFCGTQDLARFDDASVDLFINMFSFQEMTLQQVTEYFEVAGRVARGGMLYNQQRVGPFAEMNRADYPYNASWSCLFDRLTIPLHAFFEAAYKL